MPNKAVHQKAGFIAGGILSLILNYQYQKKNKEYINLEELITWGVGGALLGCFAATLPDLIEPAYDPCHRKNLS